MKHKIMPPRHSTARQNGEILRLLLGVKSSDNLKGKRPSLVL